MVYQLHLKLFSLSRQKRLTVSQKGNHRICPLAHFELIWWRGKLQTGMTYLPPGKLLLNLIWNTVKLGPSFITSVFTSHQTLNYYNSPHFWVMPFNFLVKFVTSRAPQKDASLSNMLFSGHCLCYFPRAADWPVLYKIPLPCVKNLFTCCSFLPLADR